MRDYAVAIAQFDGLSRAKPGQESPGVSQLTQSDRRHFRRLWHGTITHCYDISAAFWPPLSETEPILRNGAPRYACRTAEAAVSTWFVVTSGE